MGAYKSTYTSKEIERKFDKIDIYNFTGKFSDDSTENDWYCTLNGKVVNLNVNPETKEFKEAIDLKIDKKITSFEKLFYDTKLEKITILDVPNITNIKFMFCVCKLLTTVDLSNFDTSNVTNMERIFSGCSSLTTLNLSNFDTSNVVDMRYMFYNCSSLNTLNLSNFDTSNVTNMERIFSGCSSLTTLDLSNFDTSNVNITNYNMFDGCNKLSYIKCKQVFKDYCIQQQVRISLPLAMKEGGSGTWDIIDAA